LVGSDLEVVVCLKFFVVVFVVISGVVGVVGDAAGFSGSGEDAGDGCFEDESFVSDVVDLVGVEALRALLEAQGRVRQEEVRGLGPVVRKATGIPRVPRLSTAS